jgi:hypothetical protein
MRYYDAGDRTLEMRLYCEDEQFKSLKTLIGIQAR